MQCVPMASWPQCFFWPSVPWAKLGLLGFRKLCMTLFNCGKCQLSWSEPVPRVCLQAKKLKPIKRLQKSKALQVKCWASTELSNFIAQEFSYLHVKPSGNGAMCWTFWCPSLNWNPCLGCCKMHVRQLWMPLLKQIGEIISSPSIIGFYISAMRTTGSSFCLAVGPWKENTSTLGSLEPTLWTLLFMIMKDLFWKNVWLTTWIHC